MGIDVSNSLLVGCSYVELEDFFERVIEMGETDEHEALVDVGEVIEQYFECVSPYYDADREDCFYGFRVQNYKELTEDWWTITKTIAGRFEELTGVKPRIRGGAHVW